MWGIDLNLFGLTIARREKSTSVPTGSGGWYSILESYAGAWQRNVEVKSDSVIIFPAVYACISLIASDIGKLRPRIRRRDNSGVLIEVNVPAFSPVLRKPNAYQTRNQFFEAWVQSKLIDGNTYILKERDGRNVVVGLYVLDPRLVQINVADDGEVFYRLSQDNLSGLQNDIMVPASEIIHDRMNTFRHQLVGVPPLIACGLAATQGDRMQQSNASFYANGARPSGLLLSETDISPEKRREIKERWQAEFGGGKQGSVAILSNKLVYQPLEPMKAADMQYVEQLRMTAEQVCSAFQVPKHFIGVGDPPSYNNIETLNQQYYSQCLQRHIEAIESCLNDGLNLPADMGANFDLDDLLRMDTATMVKTYGDAVQRGMAVNEYRAKLGLPPVDGGDVPFLQEQNWPINLLADRPTPSREITQPIDQPDPPPQRDQTQAAVAAMRMKFAERLYG